MTTSRRPVLSPLSAAVTLAQWTQTHGRPPRCSECTGQEGLHWYPTYYEAFALSTWSAIVDAASTLTQGWGLSGGSISATPRKRCLNAPECGALIPDEGPAIRLCGPCQQQARHPGAWVEPLIAPHRWRRWGIKDIEGDDWMEQIDWR